MDTFSGHRNAQSVAMALLEPMLFLNPHSTHFHEGVPKNQPSMTKFRSAAFHGGDCGSENTSRPP
jgi:hypothetical protein